MSTAKTLTATVLKGILTDAVLSRDVLQDFNNFTAGVYTFDQTTKNHPDGINTYGLLIVFVYNNNVFQIAVSQFGDIYTRIKWNNNIRAWKEITTKNTTT